ncbi:MAG: iron-containing alcohol dehydrogenase [Pirellulales bacterium]|nr:iron-containing alcohol dehydrogenase [Pirellulales bacterium]
MEITGQTNVLSQRFGSGSIDGLGRELGQFVVTSMEIPWRLVRDRLGAKPAAVLMVDSLELDVVERQIAAAPPCDTVLAVGGGQAIDLGKYMAFKRGCRLVTVPTIVSVDAFVTPKAAVRRNHRVEYLGGASPDPLVIDYDLIRTAPRQLNIAGVGDLLSIHTGTFDWELAHRAGRDAAEPFSADDVRRARDILRLVEEHADDIRQVTDAGLQAIVDGYLLINTVCLPAGHYRTEEGSEHYLFYELEERTGRAFIHGQIVGLGVYLLSRLQENRHAEVVSLMDRLGLEYQPADMQIDHDTLVASLTNLRSYVESRGLWYTVINERPITATWIDDALRGLRFA